MKRKTILIICSIVVLLVLFGVTASFRKDAPDKNSTEEEKALFISEHWSDISKDEELKATNGIWIVFAIQFISPTMTFVGFEDGHDSHIALYDMDAEKIVRVWKSQGTFSSAEWNLVKTQYGSKNYPVGTHVLSVERSGRLEAFDSLTKVSENVFVK